MKKCGCSLNRTNMLSWLRGDGLSSYSVVYRIFCLYTVTVFQCISVRCRSFEGRWNAFASSWGYYWARRPIQWLWFPDLYLTVLPASQSKYSWLHFWSFSLWLISWILLRRLRTADQPFRSWYGMSTGWLQRHFSFGDHRTVSSYKKEPSYYL